MQSRPSTTKGSRTHRGGRPPGATGGQASKCQRDNFLTENKNPQISVETVQGKLRIYLYVI